MIKQFLAFTVLILTISCKEQVNTPIKDIQLIPFPNHIVLQKETINLSNGLQVSEGIYKDYLNKELTRSKIPTNQGIKVVFEKSQLDSLGDEGYQLIAKHNKISILSNTKSGIFYGIQTLLQLVKLGKIQTFEIIDKPQFQWRSYMLDEARYFQGKETVKRLLDEMAHLKMNVFHWHLTNDAGWRIEIKKYPLLTEIGSKRDSTQTNDQGKKWDSKTYDGVPHEGFYTQEEIKEIVAYANDLNITIIPEISIPGHASAAIASYSWLGTLLEPIKVPENFGVLKTVFNPASERSITFIHDVLSEVSQLFTGNTIHIGGDEVKFDQWKNNKEIASYMKKYKLANYRDVQVKFTNDVSHYIESTLGKRLMGWNEIMGENVHAWSTKDSNSEMALSKNAIIHFWRGTPENFKKAIDAGHQIVNSNHEFTYLDYTYKQLNLETAYNFNPVPSELSKFEASQIIGLGTQMWGEWTPTKKEIFYQTFPRIAAYAETGWTASHHKNYKRFYLTLPHLLKEWGKAGIYVSHEDK